jgi:hypothetical protein
MSLSESAVKTARCQKCDADVRDGSVFCYNCGGRVVGDAAENIASSDSSIAAIGTATKPAPGLLSARDIRRRERTFDRKPKKVVWEAANDAPDLQLIILTVGVIVFTTVVVLLVLYLR